MSDSVTTVFFLFTIAAIIYALLQQFAGKVRIKSIIAFAAFVLFGFSAMAYYNYEHSQINYKNWHEYATKTGNISCMPCHQDINDSYHESEMGMSYDKMSDEHKDFDIADSKIYDPKSDFYYQIILKNSGKFYMQEWRMADNKADTLHFLEFKIDHVVGSGANTKSFIFHRNDYY